MTLQEIIARLAKIEEEVRAASTAEAVEKLAEEKKDLLERKANIEALEQRKATALALSAGTAQARSIGVREPMIVADFRHMAPEEVRATEAYSNGFFKRLLGRQLSDIEQRANEIASGDAVGVIPTAASTKIFDLMKQYAPLLNEIYLLNIPGNVTVAVESTNNAAKIHTENATETPATDTLTNVTLSGYEIFKLLRISAKLSTMSIPSFESWLVEYLARAISKKIGNLLIYGTGSSQPKGIDYMDTWSDTGNAVQWGAAAPTADEILEQVSYLKPGYHNGAKWLVNAQTFWGKIVGKQDNSKYKILSDDYKRMLGYEIIFDDNVAVGDLFFGNFREGLIANLSQDIYVARSTESGFTANATDFRGTAVFDCTVPHNEGFVKGANTLTAGA